MFFVKDDGVGFDGSLSDEIFRPFSRLHAAQGFPGTGIGLATVRRALTRLGGSCQVESAPGQGTCVYFTLGPS